MDAGLNAGNEWCNLVAIAAYGYGLDSVGAGTRLTDVATILFQVEEVEVQVEEQFEVVVELPPSVTVEVPQVEVEIE